MNSKPILGAAAIAVGTALVAASAAGIATATDVHGSVHIEVTTDQPSASEERIDAPEVTENEDADADVDTEAVESEEDTEEADTDAATETDAETATEATSESKAPKGDGTCTPESDTPSFEVARYPNPDGTLTIKGKGWCTKDGKNGGSRIAFKIDEGKIVRLNDHIHENTTVWGVVDADDDTGDFEYKMQLPDGTDSGENGSKPVLTKGAHTIRMLSGSIKDGDVSRTRPTKGDTKDADAATFIVGDYVPNGEPEPLDYAKELGDAAANGVSVEKTDSELKVTIPGASAGDWVYLTAYKEDGSPRYPWKDWFQVGDDGVVTAPLDGVNLPAGMLKVVAQNGNPGEVGKLIGWGWLDVPKKEKPGKDAAAAAPAKSEKKKAPARRGGGGETVEYVTVGGADGTTKVSKSTKKGKTSVTSEKTSSKSSKSGADKKKPAKTPKSPVRKASELNSKNRGSVTGTAKGTVLTVTIKDAKPGDWIYVYAFDPKPQGLGWVQLDDKRQLTVDAEGMAPGKHKFAFVDEKGDLLGWAEIKVTDETTGLDQDEQEAVAPASFSPKLMTATDWVLIIASLALVEMAIIGMFLRKNRRNP